MGTEVNEDLGQIGSWGKSIFGANGHLGKMTIWEKGVGYPKIRKGVPQVPCVHFPKCLHMGTGANGFRRLGERGILSLQICQMGTGEKIWGK